LKKNAGDNESLKAEYQKMIDQNASLLKDIESTKVNTEIMLAAKDAINAKDILAFINMDNIKVTGKGDIVGVDAEIARLKTEKPYLFGGAEKKKGGTDNKDDTNKPAGGMNNIIRRAAGLQI
jgi:hypothetical protein